MISLTFLTDSAEMRALPILPARAHALQQSTLMNISVIRPPDIETRSRPPSLAASLAALPSMWRVRALHSSVPAFLIEFFGLASDTDALQVGG
jgi:hypothetical protein